MTAEFTSEGPSSPGAGTGQGLIASDRVEGTSVRRSGGEKIGTIDRLVIEKRSGRVVYAVMSVGGILGMGEGTRTVPWSVLTYNTEFDAYELNLSDDQLRDTPQGASGGIDPSADREWEDHVRSYFQAAPHVNEAVARATDEVKER